MSASKRAARPATACAWASASATDSMPALPPRDGAVPPVVTTAALPLPTCTSDRSTKGCKTASATASHDLPSVARYTDTTGTWGGVHSSLLPSLTILPPTPSGAAATAGRTGAGACRSSHASSSASSIASASSSVEDLPVKPALPSLLSEGPCIRGADNICVPSCSCMSARLDDTGVRLDGLEAGVCVTRRGRASPPPSL